MEQSFPPELLAQHGNFVRVLALHLVRDAHVADDVAQETWMRVLAARPVEGGLRPWLRRVVSNLAANWRRTEGGRVAREHGAARAEALPAADQELVQAELLREVVDAVLALEEPYRATILARYFHGRTAARIAAETNTPAATVRSREQRALEQLRTRLDRSVAGGRGTWALALGRLAAPAAPLGAPPASSTSSPTSSPTSSSASSAGASAASAAAVAKLGLGAKLGLAAAIVAGGVWIVRASSAGDPARALPVGAGSTGSPAVSAAALAGSAQPAGPAVALADPAQRSAPSGRVAVAPSSAGGRIALTGGECEVSGRLLLPGGAPAAGADVALRYGVIREPGEELELPAEWSDPSCTTESDGSFSLVFVPPHAFAFTLDTHLAGYASEGHDLGRIEPGTHRVLGELELAAGGTLEGRLVDANGAPLQFTDLEALAAGPQASWGEIPVLEPTWAFAPIDPVTGAFHFDDLRPGAVTLAVVRARNAWLGGPAATVVAGTTTTADIVYTGPDLAQRIGLRLAHPLQLRPGPEAVVLTGAGIDPRHPVADTNSQRLVFDGVPSGEYTITVADERYETATLAGVTPGSDVRIELVGSSALQLDVRDALGNAVALYAVDVTLHPDTGSNGSTFFFERRMHDGKSALADGLLENMVAGDWDVRVSAAGVGEQTLAVEGLAAGETRSLSFVLEPQGAQQSRANGKGRRGGAPGRRIEVKVPAR